MQSRLGQHVAHRGHVTGPVRHRGGNRRAQPVLAEFPPQRQHRHHGAGAVLLAVPLFQPIPQLIVTGGPATGLAPLRQWFRSGEGTRFLAQHIKVMLEIEHMLTAAMAAFVAGNQAASVPDLDVQRMNTRFHPAARAGRHRIEVGLHRDAALLVDQREHHLRQVEAFRRARQQMAARLGHRGTNSLAAPVQHPCLVGAAPVSSSAFNASRSATQGTGTRWLRRK